MPDIMKTNRATLNLLDFGVEGAVRHTAGHTPGSLAVELSSQNALVGDLNASGIFIGGVVFKKSAIRPTFEDDLEPVARELEGLAQRGSKRFYMGHDDPLEVDEVLRQAEVFSKLALDLCALSRCNNSAH